MKTNQVTTLSELIYYAWVASQEALSFTSSARRILSSRWVLNLISLYPLLSNDSCCVFVMLMKEFIATHSHTKIFILSRSRSIFMSATLVEYHISFNQNMSKLLFDPLSTHIVNIIINEVHCIIIVLVWSLNEYVRNFIFNKFDFNVLTLFFKRFMNGIVFSRLDHHIFIVQRNLIINRRRTFFNNFYLFKFILLLIIIE